MNSNKKAVALDWMRKIHILEHAHRLESVKWNKYNTRLGITSVIIAAIITSISSVPELRNTLLSNLISSIGGVLVAILAGIQTFLKPSEYAEKHRVASMTFESLRHKMEFILEFITDDSETERELQSFRSEWDQVDSINIAHEHYNLASDWVSNLPRYAPLSVAKSSASL